MAQESPQPPLPKLKLSEAAIDSESPWADDLLDRKELAEKLTTLVYHQIDPLRISLHGPWGTGKTFLLRRWTQHLSNQGFRAVYFNAWEEDFLQDPLVPMLGRIREELGPQYREIIKATGKLLGQFLIEAGAIVIQSQTGLTGREVLSRIWGRIRAFFNAKNNLTDRHQHLKETEEQLTVSLKELASEITNSTGQPLVVVIDELDRCRPAYAVECLERVKHLLEIPNIVFLFGVNRDELCQSIRHTNGNIDASTYLQRFFDLEFNLPPVKTWQFYLTRLEDYGLPGFFNNTWTGAQKHLAYPNWQSSLYLRTGELLEGMGLSLRETEQCVRIIAVAVRSINWEEPPSLRLLVPLSILKVKNPGLFKGFAEGSRQNLEVVNYIQNSLIENGHPVINELSRALTEIEVHLAEANRINDPSAAQQLIEVSNGQENPDGMNAISQRPKGMDKRELAALRGLPEYSRDLFTNKFIYDHQIASLIRAIDLAGLNQRP